MPEEVTCGVAIAVPEPFASELSAWRMRVGDVTGVQEHPHVTLLPPTEIPAVQLHLVEEHLAQVASEVAPFDMHLAGTGTFRPVSPVVFIQIARGVASCEQLERAIRRGPLARELDFLYHPHVTVAHKVADAALDEAYEGLANFSARFIIDRFALFDRDSDGCWNWRTEYVLTQ